MLKLGRDINGNKILKYVGNKETRGFSVQTLGNLPKTHKMINHTMIEHIAFAELNDYISDFGTERQKEILEYSW